MRGFDSGPTPVLGLLRVVTKMPNCSAVTGIIGAASLIELYKCELDVVHNLTQERKVTIELAGTGGTKAAEVVNQMRLIVISALDSERCQVRKIVRLE